MKKLTTVFFCSALALSVSAREKTVIAPYYRYNGAGFTVKRIVMNDTATALHCTVEQSKISDWSISGNSVLKANGKEYILRHAERYICPKDSGTRRAAFHLGDMVNATVQTWGDRKHYNADSLILYFAPLPAKTKTFDFSEGNGPNDWRFYGLRTDDKPWPVSKLPKATNTESEITELPDFVCKEKGVAVLKGHLYGAEGIKGLGIGVPNFKNFDGTSAVKCDIDSLGNYRIEISTYRPRFIFLNLPPFSNYQHKVCVMMVPNETQHLDWDMVAAENAIHDVKDDKIDINPFFTVSGRYAPLTRAANLHADFINFNMYAENESSIEQYTTSRREILDKQVEALKQDNRLRRFNANISP